MSIPFPMSVIIPTYNREKYIATSIDSVLNQTRVPHEIIVVDDGSTDTTYEIIKMYGNRIKYIHQENAGQANARNTGMEHASSDWVAFLDSDDFWEPDFMEKMAARHFRQPEAKLIYCDLQWVDECGLKMENKYPLSEFPEGWIFFKLFNVNYIASTSCVLADKLFLKKLGGFRKIGHSEDYDLWLRAAAEAPFASVPEKLVNYRRHDTNLTDNKHRAISGWMTVRLSAYELVENKKVNSKNESIADSNYLLTSIYEGALKEYFSDNFFKEVRRIGLPMIRLNGHKSHLVMRWIISFLPETVLLLLDKIYMKFKRKFSKSFK